MNYWLVAWLLLALAVLVSIVLSLVSIRQLALIAIGAAKEPNDFGPPVGHRLPRFDFSHLMGERYEVESRIGHLLLFASTDCPSCKMLLPDAIRSARQVDGLIIHCFMIEPRTGTGAVSSYAEVFLEGVDGVSVLDTTALGTLGIAVTPFAVMLDRERTVRHHGIPHLRNIEQSLHQMEAR